MIRIFCSDILSYIKKFTLDVKRVQEIFTKNMFDSGNVNYLNYIKRTNLPKFLTMFTIFLLNPKDILFDMYISEIGLIII